MKESLSDLQILAIEYAKHCLAQMPVTTHETEKIEKMLAAYQTAFVQMTNIVSEQSSGF